MIYDLYEFQDLPCPVLIRELMVWCWQQEEKDRPSAQEVVGLAKADQFLRLADAIRINNFGSQVDECCMRLCSKPYEKLYMYILCRFSCN